MNAWGENAPPSVHLSLLSERLRIARLPLPALKSEAHSLIQLLLMEETEGRFFSLTVTEDEVSVVVGEEEAKVLPPTAEFAGPPTEVWRALHVNEGALGFEQCAVVMKLSMALSEVSIFYISVYSTDYVLIRDEDVAAALWLLRQSFIVDTDGIEGEGPSSPRRPSTDAGRPWSPVRPAGCPHRHELSVLPDTAAAAMSRMDRDDLSVHASALLRLVFFDDELPQLLSVTKTAEEVSVLHAAPWFSEYCAERGLPSSPRAEWRPVKVHSSAAGGQGLGFDETGIVSSYSSTLASIEVSIFYLSTFSADFVLFQADRSDEAVEALRECPAEGECRLALRAVSSPPPPPVFASVDL